MFRPLITKQPAKVDDLPKNAGVIFMHIIICMFFCFLCFISFVLPTRHHTPTDDIKMKTKLIPTPINFMIFAILHFYNFTLVTDTTVQNNDEISLHFKPMRLIFTNYSV